MWRWQRRFAEAGVEGLLRGASRKPGKAPVPADVVQQLIALTCAEPPGEATHWTGCAIARAMGVSLRTLQRIWQADATATRSSCASSTPSSAPCRPAR